MNFHLFIRCIHSISVFCVGTFRLWKFSLEIVLLTSQGCEKSGHDSGHDSGVSFNMVQSYYSQISIPLKWSCVNLLLAICSIQVAFAASWFESKCNVVSCYVYYFMVNFAKYLDSQRVKWERITINIKNNCRCSKFNGFLCHFGSNMVSLNLFWSRKFLFYKVPLLRMFCVSLECK